MASECAVCIIDDDKGVRVSLGALLKTAGYDVKTYDSALEYLAAPTSCACLIVDVRMPGMSGLQLQAELSQRGIALPVIIISGHADVPMAVAAMKCGAIDFIEKPFRFEAIIDSVQRALEHGARLRERELSAETANGRIALLTAREHEVFLCVAAGKANKVIAHELGISARTVEIHRAKVMEKLEARSLPHLVRMALVAEGSAKKPPG